MFVSLSRADRAVVVDAFLLAIPVELGLRCIGFARLVKLIDKTCESRRPRHSLVDVERAAGLVERVSRFYPFEATCLRKSLVLWWLLKRRGVPARLRLGVRTLDGFEAHAWVECDGRPVFDGDLAHRFAPLPLEL
jgi:hypothetical protein